MKTLYRFLLACLLGLLVFPPFIAQADETLPVVASFSILADMTRRVGGERVQVHSLIGENGDAHAFQPSPADAKRLGRAALVVVNGLGFEGWIERLVAASGYRGKVLVASANARLLKPTHAGHDHAHVHVADPHAWQDAGNALRYVDNIAAALSEVDPAGTAIYAGNAARYKDEIAALDADIRRTFATIPEARRRVVTTHDAFAYFGRAYGIDFIAPLGIHPEAEPSAREVGRLIRQIRRDGIAAVFMENIGDPRLLERIRRESGARLGGTLYSDSLSTRAGPAATYLDMMRHNAKTLSAALIQ